MNATQPRILAAAELGPVSNAKAFPNTLIFQSLECNTHTPHLRGGSDCRRCVVCDDLCAALAQLLPSPAARRQDPGPLCRLALHRF
eukprot:631081-Rhodomonas_salina.1